DHGDQWIDHGDHLNSTLSYLRRGNETDDVVVVVVNFTPMVRHNFRLGVPLQGDYSCALNSDDREYGGTGNYAIETLSSTDGEWNGRPAFIEFSLPPLVVVVFEKG
ncbi:MAG: alpha amylase C-terminal domain-containing protein, partial [Bacteroidota bacterium]